MQSLSCTVINNRLYLHIINYPVLCHWHIRHWRITFTVTNRQLFLAAIPHIKVINSLFFARNQPGAQRNFLFLFTMPFKRKTLRIWIYNILIAPLITNASVFKCGWFIFTCHSPGLTLFLCNDLAESCEDLVDGLWCQV